MKLFKKIYLVVKRFLNYGTYKKAMLLKGKIRFDINIYAYSKRTCSKKKGHGELVEP